MMDLNFFLKNKNMGLYVWGDVGRGKTLLVNSYLSQLKSDDHMSFHFIDFMNFVHEELNTHSGKKNPLHIVCKSLTYGKKIIFIDEFQVEDVADAMILSDVIPSLIKKRSKIFFTSNFPIKGLYPNGLQRDKFINSMSVLRDKLNYFQLKGDLDYRLRNIINQHSKESSMIEIQSFIESLFITDVKQINPLPYLAMKFIFL